MQPPHKRHFISDCAIISTMEFMGSYTHGFNLQYIDGSNRWNETIKLGYTF